MIFEIGRGVRMLSVPVVGRENLFERICASYKVANATMAFKRNDGLHHRICFGEDMAAPDDAFLEKPFAIPTVAFRLLAAIRAFLDTSFVSSFFITCAICSFPVFVQGFGVRSG